MTRAEYEASICGRLSEAEHVPFRQVFLDNWQPSVARCHENVDRWVQANAGAIALRGWVTYASFGTSLALTAHSVVRGLDGILFDITPLENEYYRRGMRFIPHVGEDQLFFSMTVLDLEIRCPCDNA